MGSLRSLTCNPLAKKNLLTSQQRKPLQWYTRLRGIIVKELLKIDLKKVPYIVVVDKDTISGKDYIEVRWDKNIPFRMDKEMALIIFDEVRLFEISDKIKLKIYWRDDINDFNGAVIEEWDH